MKRKLITATLFIASIVGAFLIGKSQAKTETIKPDIYSYIKCNSFETFEVVNGNELHIIANDGNEYIFTKQKGYFKEVDDMYLSK